MSRLRLIAPLFLLTSCSGDIAAQDGVSNSRQLPEHEVGEEYIPCEGCPVFVRVPNAPDDLRPIQYVAKYELTWAKYLSSVTDGVCAWPVRTDALRKQGLSRSDMLDVLTIDWPISILTKSEIECYSDWLQRETALTVAVPSENEWNWFAAGDLTDANFPWGDNVNDPPAAVPGVAIPRADEFIDRANGSLSPLVPGVRVGMFPPNSWGLFDLVGNQYELTSTTYSGEEWLRANPESRFAGQLRDRDVVIIKGGNRYFRNWTIGINDRSRSARIFNGEYSTNLAVRFVLIGEAAQ